jgi:hypothetical protein
MRPERWKDSGRKYSGPVLDAAAGLNPSTRRGWRERGFFETTDNEYTFADVLSAAARAAAIRYGITSPGTTKLVIKAIVHDMRDRLDNVPAEPRYLVVCPLPDPEDPGPVSERMIAQKVIGFADEGGAMCIATDLSRKELQEHFVGAAESSFVLDTAGLLRRVLKTLRDSQGPKP